MAREENQYQKLPGRGYASDGPVAVARIMSRLYLGKDHLLRVSTSWSEYYRRFYYNDIQAVVVSRTKRGLIWNIVLAILCAAFLFWCLSVTDQTGRIVLACIAAFFGTFLLVNALMGATCRVKILTHVGSEPLPSLKRMRVARKTIALLKSRIEAVQGQLQSGEIPDQITNFEHIAGGSGSRVSAPAQNNYRGGVHGWLFSMLLIETVAMIVTVFAQSTGFALVLLFVTLGTAVLTLIALVKQSGSALSSGLRTVTWTVLAQMILSFVLGYVMMIYVIIGNPKISNNQWSIFSAIASIPVMQNPWLLGMFCFMVVFALVLATIGWILLLNFRAAFRHEPAAGPLSS